MEPLLPASQICNIIKETCRAERSCCRGIVTSCASRGAQARLSAAPAVKPGSAALTRRPSLNAGRSGHNRAFISTLYFIFYNLYGPRVVLPPARPPNFHFNIFKARLNRRGEK